MDNQLTRQKTDFLKLRVYQLAEQLADEIWVIVNTWSVFCKTTLGRQLVNAADSIGANIAEGVGRGTFQDNRRFVRVARGSLNETRHWLRRSHKRGLLSSDQIASLSSTMNELSPRLNAYLKSIGTVGRQRTTDQ